MALAEPSWWYKPQPTSVARLLSPIGHAYGRVAQWRYERATPLDVGVPVICVGNFTAGGTGKTPLALAIADLLERLGERPVFLSRGYGGRLKGPHLVDAAADAAADVGDEPLLLAARAPTVIGRDRRRSAAVALTHPSRPSVIVMDDGLQNPSLVKALSIALVDAARGLGNGEIIPAGPLRAALEHQLARVDAVVVNRGAGSMSGAAVIERMRSRFNGVVIEAHVQPAAQLGWLKDSAVVAYAGIGNPDRFFHMLTDLGARVVAARSFPDHHAFREDDAAALLAAAAEHAALLVTTEKDLVRLTGAGGAPARLAGMSRCVPIELVPEPRDLGQLTTLLSLALRRGTRTAPG